MNALRTVALLSVFAAAGASPVLQPRAFTPVRTGSVTPEGWLLTQLGLQADGLSGHLSQFWNDIQHSIWIGGGGDGGLHERTPYWLNGVVPLAFLLDNANASKFGGDPRGIYRDPSGPSVDITAQVEQYVQYILSHVNDDGWLGPQSAAPSSDGDQFWGPSNVLQALYQYSEGMQASDAGRAAAAVNATHRHLVEQHSRMKTASLTSWAAARWMDMAMTAEWLVDHAGLTADQDATMLELVDMLHDQGSDWDGWFDSFVGNAGGHNVNNAQGLKSAAVWYRRSANETMRELSTRRKANLDRLYGLPTGMFNGDELLPSPATRNPSRGIELCGVVEAMFSYTTMFSILGDAAFAERAERIAYNALPATWASPRGGDMWAHQYLQAVNQVKAIQADPHVWTHDGDLSETYGLEPNYGCCTANFNQGWPKFAHSTVFGYDGGDSDGGGGGGVAVAIWAPVSVAVSATASVEVKTDYPFGDDATVVVKNDGNTTLGVKLRIPSWAPDATVNGGAVVSGCNGTFFETEAPSGATTTFDVAFNPTIRLERWDNGTVSVHRGALMYSIPIEANFTVYGHHFGDENQASDYYAVPLSPWQYALDEHSLVFRRNAPLGEHGAPFNHTNWPTVIDATVRPLSSWGMALNSAAEPPASPACVAPNADCGSPTSITLVPHGGTDLRIGEIPLSGL